MTGGSSFVPIIRKLFAEKFGAATPIRAGQEFTSVAEGLAIHALELRTKYRRPEGSSAFEGLTAVGNENYQDSKVGLRKETGTLLAGWNLSPVSWNRRC